ncbi:MAG TPA: hypothetical protein VNV44_06990 [Solirubrobacteraceae bacterium]|nr:hypothetical protein [Solirubrobacteraceae bacterium]
MSAATSRLITRRALVASVVVWTMALAPHAAAAGAGEGPGTATTKPPVSATLESCVEAPEQAERSATFAGEMSMIPGAAKMEMRIDVLERTPSEEAFHVVAAPGLGVWRWAAPGVKTYRYLKEVTNLAAPAFYRAAVRFRWVNAKGKLVKAYELRTQRCIQSLLKPSEVEAPTSE